MTIKMLGLIIFEATVTIKKNFISIEFKVKTGRSILSTF